jgi:hypothetical protein
MQTFELDESYLNMAARVPWYTRLWASVLRRAIVDWILYRTHDNVKLKKIGVNAENWIFSEERINDISSFYAVCELMNMEPEYIHRKIREMTEEQTRRLRGMEFGDEW